MEATEVHKVEKYALYLRKSRTDQDAERRGEEETLARHRKALTELADRMGIEVSAVYQEVVSGESIETRPEMQRLLDDVSEGLFTGVLVMEVERLARGDTKDQGIVAEIFKMSGTKIITPSKIYDPENEFDEEYFEFGLFMSRREYKTINRRIQRGRIASAKEGKFLSSTAPYGYIKTKIQGDKGYTLTPDPERAEVVKMIFDWYVNGDTDADGLHRRLGMSVIAQHLDALHIKPLIKDTWSRASISDMLQNPVYIGKIRWSHRREIKEMSGGKIVKVRRENAEAILVDGLHPAIVDSDTFYKAQKIISGNARTKNPPTKVLQNPLAGLVYCKKCGALMTRLAPHPHSPYAALKCPTPQCDTVSAPLYLVENKLLETLRPHLAELRLQWTNQTPQQALSGSVKDQALIKAQDELNGLLKQRESAYDLLEQGIYTVDVFNARAGTLSERIAAAEKAIKGLQKDLDKDKDLQAVVDRFLPAIDGILDGYDGLDAAGRNYLLKSVLSRVDYQKDQKNSRTQREVANFSLNIHPKLIGGTL